MMIGHPNANALTPSASTGLRPSSEATTDLIADQESIVMAAARLAIGEFHGAHPSLSHLDIVRDVLVLKGGLRPFLFTSVEEAVAVCNESIRRLSIARSQSSIPLEVPNREISLSKSYLKSVSDNVASDVLTKLHYLHAPRARSINLGLYTEEKDQESGTLLGVASVSACDSPTIADLLQTHISKILTLSRFVMLPGAPKNSGSRLLALVLRHIAAHVPNIAAIATYNNRNLAFKGTIYKAANWQLLGYEEKLPDVLLDGHYVTLRNLRAQFGTYDSAELQKRLGTRVKILPPPWFSLEIYAYAVHHQKRHRGGIE